MWFTFNECLTTVCLVSISCILDSEEKLRIFVPTSFTHILTKTIRCKSQAPRLSLFLSLTHSVEFVLIVITIAVESQKFIVERKHNCFWLILISVVANFY